MVHLYFSSFFLSPLFMISTGLKNLYSFLYRECINHLHLLNFLLLPSLSHMWPPLTLTCSSTEIHLLNINWPYRWISFWSFHFVLLIYISILMPKRIALIIVALQNVLKWVSLCLSLYFHFSKWFLLFLVFTFHINFRFRLILSTNKSLTWFRNFV
jgi:hypothetical protein